MSLTTPRRLAEHVQLHAARSRCQDIWLIVFHTYTLDEIEHAVERTQCRDLESAIKLFVEIGMVILARWRALDYALETQLEAAA